LWPSSPGENEIGSFAREIGGEQEVRVGDGDDGAVRPNGNRRWPVVRIERLTP
jgi:hypothetical protein